MKIAISGLHGTGKSTIAKLIAEELKIKFYSTGYMFRELAQEKEMTLEQLSMLAEDDRNIDQELDAKIKKYAEQEECVLDNQLSPYLLGNIIEYCVLLKCAKDVRISRMADRDDDNIEEKISETLIREESEQKRFMDYYNIDVLDAQTILGTFDLIVDTTNTDKEGVFRIVSKAITEFYRTKK